MRVFANTYTPTSVSCTDLPRENSPFQGGDKLATIYLSNSNELLSSCGTITLGGLSVDGVRGFVTAAHNAIVTDRGQVIAHDVDDLRFIGPQIHGVYNHLGIVKINKGTSPVDVLFAEYPSRCLFPLYNVCLSAPLYTSTIEAMKIEGNTRTYTVTGVQQSRTNLPIHMSGAVSGEQSGTIKAINTVLPGTPNRVDLLIITPTPQAGDSGAPVFTTASSSGNTKIVGMISGTGTSLFRINGNIESVDVAMMVPWNTISRHLDLDSIR